MNTVKTILKPLASLRITVGLLLIAIVLVLAGTTAQRDLGLKDVLDQFFHRWGFAKIYLRYFQPTPAAGKSYFLPNAWFPLPGGYMLIVALLVNLLAAHTVRFKFTKKRIGVILIHSGLILLLVGELVTGFYAIESRMLINVGSSSNWTADIREAELAVIDHSAKDHDNIVAVSEKELKNSVGQTIHDARLPFDVKVDRFYENTALRGPMEHEAGIDRLATAGNDKIFGLQRIPKSGGTEATTDLPSAFVTLSKNGESLGTYLLTTRFDPILGVEEMEMLRNRGMQQVNVDGKTYDLTMRFRRYYKPYTLYLSKFTHDRFLGTDIARNFASDVRLVDPAHHVDRSVHIWMNHPLRCAGETFYQADFDHAQDRYTVLQVVKNPAWRMPYIACAIGALGMVIHFLMHLTGFLRRKFAAKGIVRVDEPRASSDRGNSKRGKQGRVPTPAGSYSLQPEPMWRKAFPVAIVAICFVYVLSCMVSTSTNTEYNWDSFARLPISFEGRVQPLSSVAINSLKILSGKESPRDEEGNKIAPIPAKWLLDVMSRSGKWADYKVFRIDLPELKETLGLAANEKMFSWNQVLNKPENGQKLIEQAQLAGQVAEKNRDPFQNAVATLFEHLEIYSRFFQVDGIEARYDLVSHPERAEAVRQALASVDPQFLTKLKSDDAADALHEALSKLDPGKLTPEQRDALANALDAMNRAKVLNGVTPNMNLYLIAPLNPGEKWQPLISAVSGSNASAEVPKSAAMFLKIVRDYTDQRAQDFNADVAAYQAVLDQALPSQMDKVGYEVFFNRFDPFLICMVFYVAVFVLTLGSWLGFNKPLARSAYWLLILTLLVHTFGLASRIYLSGRPPVTNLYSSAVFIAWGMVVLAVILEAIFRNGIALVAASAAGFASLLVASALSITEGDTMKQLQAVLDTNFWLATHVVCVTLGYTSTFLAGLLAIVYVLRGVLSTSLSTEESKDNAKMVYGIVCFAMLFSFVGTILGGIWADQSWGRFWGWDPKENGAVLIVLWNALILHARWGGLVRERGVMVLAILGNIVTSWSWFGTNMLGIGLHSYGFMDSAQSWLELFMLSQVVLAGIGLIPIRFWASFATAPAKPARPIGRRTAGGAV